jgi:Tol biopolymer transport system component
MDRLIGIYTVNVSDLRERKVAEVLSTTPALGRVDWSPDGRYLLTAEQDTPATASALVLIGARNGEKRRLTMPDPHISGDTDAVFSPDGNWIAFRRTVGPGVDDLYIAPAPAPDSSGRGPLPANSLKRLTFDNTSIDGHAWTPDGRSIVLASKRGGGSYGLWRIAVSGSKPARLTQAGIVAVRPAISILGNRLAYESVINDSNIWELDIKSAVATRLLIASTMLDTSPQYSPDGTRIAFRSTRSGSDEIWVSNADGSQPRQITHYSGPLTGSPRWSPDGRQLAFDSRQADNADIYIVPADGGTPRRFTTEPGSDVVPSWSRDGRFIYFASDRSGPWQVWRQPVAAGAAQQITVNGGFAAFESLDGHYVYFTKAWPEHGVFRVPVVGGPEKLVLAAIAGTMWGNWALGRGGIYFLQSRGLPTSVAAIQFFDFATESTRELGGTTGPPMAWDSGLAVSPDERKLLYAQVDRAGSNLYIAENFH